MQMNEFKSPPGFSSGPLDNGGEVREEDSVKWVSQGKHILVFQTEGNREFLCIISQFLVHKFMHYCFD